MQAKKSEMILKDFVITKCFCEFIPLQNDIKASEAQKKQIDYPIDIDYMLNEQDNDKIIFIRVEINPEKQSGYSICAEGLGLFSFTEEVSNEEIATLLHYSGVSMCINNIRAFIANLTASYPMGKFNFYAIDLNALIDEKISQQTESE